MHASRALRSIAFVVGAIAAGGASAATPALVVDVDSGKVLYAERATDPWFPASITKLMTTYVALSAVQEGKLTLDTLLRMSENAVSPRARLKASGLRSICLITAPRWRRESPISAAS